MILSDKYFALVSVFLILITSNYASSNEQLKNQIEASENQGQSQQFVLTSRNEKQRFVSFGPMANLEEVCNLLNHPIFSSVKLPNEEDMFSNEYENFFNQKLLEVHIDSIIEQFQSRIPFVGGYGDDFYIGRSAEHHYQFENNLKREFYPQGTYDNLSILKQESCLPKTVRISMARASTYNTPAIEWWSNKSRDYSTRRQIGLYVTERDPCLFCIFFIKDFHDDLTDRFNEILTSNKLRQKELMSEIDEMAIRKGEIDQNPDLLDNQAFKLQKILNEEKRKAELNRLSKEIELKNLEYRQLVSENNGNPVTINITIQPGDHMKEELYEGRLKKLQDTSERLDDLIQRQISKKEERLQAILLNEQRRLKEEQRRTQEAEQRRLEKERKEEVAAIKSRRNYSFLAFDLLFMLYVFLSLALWNEKTKDIADIKRFIGNQFRSLISSINELFGSIVLYIKGIFTRISNWIFGNQHSESDTKEESLGSENDQKSGSKKYQNKRRSGSKKNQNKRSSKRTKSNKAKKSYYEILGISTNASQADIKKAYQRLAMKYHPDRNKAKNASEKFKEIQKAFQTLNDPNERSKYDRKL